MDPQELVEVYSVDEPTHAELIKNFLEGEGIPCSLNQIGQFGLTGVEDIEILVRAGDAERARALLEEHERSQRQFSEEEDEDEDEDFSGE